MLKTANGKIRRSACRSLYESGQTGRPAPALVQQFLGLMQASVVPELKRLRQTTKTGLYAIYASLLVVAFAPIVWLGVVISPGISSSRRFLRAAARLFLRSAGLFPHVQGLDELPAGRRLCSHRQSPELPRRSRRLGCPANGLRLCRQARTGQSPGLPASYFALSAPPSSSASIQKAALPTPDGSRIVLRAGESLIIFPEGTFERRPGLRSFYMGAFMAAAEAEVPIIPSAIIGTRSVLRAESWFMRHSHIEVKAGSPIRPSGTSWQALIKLRDQAREAILTRCGEPDLASEPTWLESGDAAGDA